jgi:RluA family pseudouridine synthase
MRVQPIRLTKEETDFVRSLVIYEDDAVLALNKPAGLSSQGGRGQVHTLDELLWAFAKKSGNRPRLVHRLDRDTSGVILTAKTQPAAGYLGKAMMARRGFQKTYLALVGTGPPDPPTGTISAPMRRVEVGREAYMRVCAATDDGAQVAVTRYRTLSTGGGAALIELGLDTGRMHQIRVHMAHMGRPLLGDARYGGALVVGGRPAPRLMLHASALAFPHPEGRKVRVEAAPPEDFVTVARNLGLSL